MYLIALTFIRSIDAEGFPNIKAMLQPRKREGDTMYYKEGVTDPDYCVLKFTAVSGRYYNNFKSEDFVIEDSTKGGGVSKVKLAIIKTQINADLRKD